MSKKRFFWYTAIGLSVAIIIFLFLFFYWVANFYNINDISLEKQMESPLPTKIVEKQFTLKKYILTPEVDVHFPTLEESIEFTKEDWDIINNPNSPLLLVNKKRRLPDNFIPNQLIIPNVRFPMKEFLEKKQMKAVAALALEKMFVQAEKDGHILYAVSGYRSFNRQDFLYHHYIKTKGLEYTKKVSAYPGSSEHQTGYAMDVSTKAENFKLTTSLGATKEGKWIEENAHKFGFIIRYPKNKTHITGYLYEPWHLRYLGNPHATFLYENDLTLEEAYKTSP